jgi:hypothetical protein
MPRTVNRSMAVSWATGCTMTGRITSRSQPIENGRGRAFGARYSPRTGFSATTTV